MILHIRGYQFTISAPYQPLHQLTPAEAAALNSLRAENIRNSVAKLVQNEINSTPNQVLHPDTLVELQNAISKFDAGYSFKPRHEPKAKPSQLDELILAVAREAAKAKLSSAPYSKDQLDQLAASLVNEAEIRDEAARRATHLAKVANSTIEDLI